ncbi:DUF6801 domain-containing protein [Streptomyces sp. HB132]|uniref:DUF6801 domain-containing protein n=1 Tax=Streptomyces sp. HB132 TaxID=767388 RepID=UPI001961C1CC|nr:DUF6801 domain-containing protein [Streptomyces sp. HB132]MBM7439772.1 hypothetical protein [Streptomyces sp. HB132]
MAKALRLAAVLGGAGGIVGGLGAGTAAARPVSLTLAYACTFPVIGDQDITARISMDIPMAHTVGKPSHRFAIRAEATVGSGLTRGLALLGVRSVDGTLDAKTRVTAPQGDLGITVPLDIVRTAVPSSGALRIPANGIAPTRTFSEAGRAEIVVGDFVVHLVPRDANGDLTPLGKFDVPCTVRAGQQQVITSFTISPAPKPSASAAPGEGGSPGRTASATTTSVPGDTDVPGSSGTATTKPPTTKPPTTTPSATKSPTAGPSITQASVAPGGLPVDDTATGPTTTADGRAGRGLILTAVGVLVVAAAASVFGLRRRNRRGPQDEG